jgi:DNA-binding NarL/FixJ family response regulator
MKVLIADDHRIVRECLKALLKNAEGIEIVGEASDGNQVIEMFPIVKPDVILLDITMPERNGWETMHELKALYQFSKVIALTLLSDSDSVRKMMEAGASGYILKNSGKQELHMLCLLSIMEEYS